MNTEERAKKRHDIINDVASLMAQIELLKRKHPEVTADILKMEEKIHTLHQEFLQYVEAEKKN